MCSVCGGMCSVGIDDAFASTASAPRFRAGTGEEINGDLGA